MGDRLTNYIISQMAIEKYGALNYDILIEEMSELTKEIIKLKRGIGNRKHIIEETGDVEIMLERFKRMEHITEDELSVSKNEKYTRLQRRIENE